MTDEDREAAIWFQVDAEFMYRWARTQRDEGRDLLAASAQLIAADSARRARLWAGIESKETP